MKATENQRIRGKRSLKPYVTVKFHCLKWWNEIGPRCDSQCQMCKDDE